MNISSTYRIESVLTHLLILSIQIVWLIIAFHIINEFVWTEINSNDIEFEKVKDSFFSIIVGTVLLIFSGLSTFIYLSYIFSKSTYIKIDEEIVHVYGWRKNMQFHFSQIQHIELIKQIHFKIIWGFSYVGANVLLQNGKSVVIPYDLVKNTNRIVKVILDSNRSIKIYPESETLSKNEMRFKLVDYLYFINNSKVILFFNIFCISSYFIMGQSGLNIPWYISIGIYCFILYYFLLKQYHYLEIDGDEMRVKLLPFFNVRTYSLSQLHVFLLEKDDKNNLYIHILDSDFQYNRYRAYQISNDVLYDFVQKLKEAKIPYQYIETEFWSDK